MLDLAVAQRALTRRAWMCRFKDTEAAAMYERAGYAETKRDMFLLPLVGYQRRFLMSKDMPHASRR